LLVAARLDAVARNATSSMVAACTTHAARFNL
jgi:hypothetical protein